MINERDSDPITYGDLRRALRELRDSERAWSGACEDSESAATYDQRAEFCERLAEALGIKL
jgi:hypothetical protein